MICGGLGWNVVRKVDNYEKCRGGENWRNVWEDLKLWSQNLRKDAYFSKDSPFRNSSKNGTKRQKTNSFSQKSLQNSKYELLITLSHKMNSGFTSCLKFWNPGAIS